MNIRKPVLLSFAIVLLCLQATVPASAQSQDSEAKMLVTEVMNRHLAASYVHELDRTAAWIAYVEGVAIMGELQDWPPEKNFSEGSLRSFIYDVGNLEPRLVPTIIALRRNAARGKVFTPDEQARFDAILQDVDTMISSSQDLLVLLQEGRMDEAGEFYRTQTRTLFRSVQGDAYTLVSAIEDDLKKARLKIRKLE